MNPGNPKIDLSQPESGTRDGTGILLGSVASIFGSMLSFGLAIEAVLFFVIRDCKILLQGQHPIGHPMHFSLSVAFVF